MMFRILLVFACVFLTCSAMAQNTVRVGVLQYGTLNWEMDVIEQLKLADERELTIERVLLGSPQALLVALQGGKVDMIINDWLWVARQKEAGRNYYFYPYSTAAGVLVARPDANIHSLADLRGKRIGIAGGTANKNYVLYRAFLNARTGIDLPADTTLKFAAPPMLNALIEQGQLDAVINFWHYAAQLNAKGMTTLTTMSSVLDSLNIKGDIPVIGWVFSQHWADNNQATLQAFLSTSASARKRMKHDDTLWQRIPSFTSKFSGDVRPYLITAYRDGIADVLEKDDRYQLQSLFLHLRANQDGNALTGTLTDLPDDIFWTRAEAH